MAETTDTENKKATVVNITEEAEKEEKEEIVNTANDYHKFWENINEDERKMSNDTPNFHIYVSHEKTDVYPNELEYDEEGNVIKPYMKKKKKEEKKDTDTEEEEE